MNSAQHFDLYATIYITGDIVCVDLTKLQFVFLINKLVLSDYNGRRLKLSCIDWQCCCKKRTVQENNIKPYWKTCFLRYTWSRVKMAVVYCSWPQEGAIFKASMSSTIFMDSNSCSRIVLNPCASNDRRLSRSFRRCTTCVRPRRDYSSAVPEILNSLPPATLLTLQIRA